MKTSTVVIKGKLLKNIKRITFGGSDFDYWLLAHLKWWINDDYHKEISNRWDIFEKSTTNFLLNQILITRKLFVVLGACDKDIQFVFSKLV